MLDALWGEREPLSPGPPGGAPAAWCPSSQGEEGARQTPRHERSRSGLEAAQKPRRRSAWVLPTQESPEAKV